MSGRFSDSPRAVVGSPTRDGLMSAADKAKLDGLQVPLSRLAYAASTDVLNGVALVANTWTDVHVAQNFTVTSATSVVLIELRLAAIFVLPATDTQVASAILLDGATRELAGSGIGKASTYGHTAGAFFWFRGFGAGTHTIKAQVFATTAATAFCRASTTPNVEWIKINCLELTP